MQCSKGSEVLLEKSEDKKIDVDSVTERNKVDIDDQSEKEIHEQRDDKVVESDKGVVEIIQTDFEEQVDDVAEAKVSSSSDKTSGTCEDVMDTENEPLTGDDDCEETSPDIIPSSQTPSYESCFQSLRRVTIPLESILPSSLDALKNKGNVKKSQAETKSKEEEGRGGIQGEVDVLDRNEVDECDSTVKKDEPVPSISKTTVSPVAGRTRRRLQQKTDGDKTPSRVQAEDEPAEQAISELTHKDEHLDEMVTETSTEKQTEPALAGISREATSSPVPSVMNKFLRPFAAGGSPCRVTLRGRNSPGVSPTTGILKRWNGNKQTIDSPSPPGKVTFHCFGLLKNIRKLAVLLFFIHCLPFFFFLKFFLLYNLS